MAINRATYGCVCLTVLAGACLSSGGGDNGDPDSSVSSTGGTMSSTGGTSSSGGTVSSTGGSDSTGSGGVSSTPPPFETAWQACSTPEDCVFIRSETCCGCMLVGVHTQFEAQARESLTVNLGNCGPVGCASPPCPVDPFPACTDGLCQALPGCSERTLEMCDLDGLCQVYNARDCQSPASPFMPRVCGQSGATTACAAQPTCRVSPAGQMLYFEDGCVPAVGYDQPCPIACE